jgi:hypothetical protein
VTAPVRNGDGGSADQQVDGRRRMPTGNVGHSTATKSLHECLTASELRPVPLDIGEM